MFDSISTQQTCRAAKEDINCTLPGYKEFATNPDIAGVGVVHAYEITACLTLIFATLLILVDGRDLFCSRSRYERLEEKEQRPYQKTFRRIFEAVVLSFSDQQLITGLAMPIAVLYYLGCSICAYRYDIVCNLILMSLVAHFASLGVISRYFSNWLLGLLRAVLIIVAFSLAGVMFAERNNSHFPTGVPGAEMNSNMAAPPLLLAAACFTSENINVTNQFGTQLKIFESPAHVPGLVEYGVLFVGHLMAILQSMLTASSRSHGHLNARKWIFFSRLGLLISA